MKIKETLLGFGNKSSYLLGIDIRQNFVRLVGLSYANSRFTVEVSAQATIKQDEISDAAVVVTLKKLLQQVPVKGKNAAVALPRSIVTFKEVQIDSDLSPTETTNFLRFNLAEQIGEGDISFDYQPLHLDKGRSSAPKVFKLVAVRQQYVDRLITVLQSAGLHPKIVDIDIYALERAARQQLQNIAGLVAVINIDQEEILMMVIDCEKIVYSDEQKIDQDSSQFSAKLAEQINLMLSLACSELLCSVDKIILGGGLVGLISLAEELVSKSKIQLVVANPFLGMELASAVSPEVMEQTAPMMLFGCGLALRVVGNYGN